MSTMLDVVGISVRFGGLLAVNDASFRVGQSELVGLIGPNGAGKTTLLNVISGIVRPSSGSIRVDGVDVTRASVPERARTGIARTFQHVGLVLESSVAANLMMAQHQRAASNIWAGVVGLARADDRALADVAQQTLDDLALGEHADRRVGDLAFGTRRLVELACAIVRRPRLLLLDEPSAGLDIAETSRLAEHLVEFQRRMGFTLLVVDHDMRLVRQVAQRIVVLNFGQVLAEGTWDQIRADPAVVETYLGTATADEQEAPRA